MSPTYFGLSGPYQLPDIGPEIPKHAADILKDGWAVPKTCKIAGFRRD
jgi:hypothetical protein